MHRPPRWKLVAWGVPAWALVVVVWVLATTRQWSALVLGLAIGAIALVVAVGAIWAWVGHNRALAHRRERVRGGRRGAPDVPLIIERDARGHAVVIADGAMDARLLVARLNDGTKVITPDEPA